MTIDKLKNNLETLNYANGYGTLNLYINGKKISFEGIKIYLDNGYVDLYLEVNDNGEIDRK